MCSESNVANAIGHLHASGLVNITGELIIPSRARRMNELKI